MLILRLIITIFLDLLRKILLNLLMLTKVLYRKNLISLYLHFKPSPTVMQRSRLNETQESRLSSLERLHEKYMISGFSNKIAAKILSITETWSDLFPTPTTLKIKESTNSKKPLVLATFLLILPNWTKEKNKLPP